jgi:hypothetical protein
MEVPAYQVNSGRDLASQPAAAAKALALPQTGGTTSASTSPVSGAKSGTLGAGQSGPPAGPTSATPGKETPVKPLNLNVPQRIVNP